jgi:hypothetical protein
VLAISQDVWLPLVALVLGYLFSLLTEAFRDRRQTVRERRAREDERAAVKAAQDEAEERRRRDFQRETLLELQEVLHDLARAYGAEHHMDLMHFRTTGSWTPRPMPSEELNERSFEAHRRCFILVARIDDDLLRGFVREMKDGGYGVLSATSEEQSREALARSSDAFELANQRIGDLLRLVY